MSDSSAPVPGQKNEPITITKAELQMLDALIELEREERGEIPTESVTIFGPPDQMAGWAKAGRWAWRNKGKLLTAATAATDFIGSVVLEARNMRTIPPEISAILPNPETSTLDELIAARDQIARAMEEKKGKE